MECQKTLRTLFASSVKHTARKSISQQRLNLQLVHDNVVFLWIENEKHIALFQASDVQAINNEETTEDGKLFLEKLACSQPIKFEVLSMKINASGKFIALVGVSGIAIVEVPDRLCRKNSFHDEESVKFCRTILLGDHLFRKKIDLEILDFQWFPGSPSDSHIVLLTNDNCLRWFDVGNNKHALSTITLHGSHEPSTPYTSMNFALAYGEIAVSFSIGPPVCGENEFMLYPIFVVRENGNVLITWTWLDKQRVYWFQKGPLRMMPESFDNYGGRFCSILCLKSSPAVVVLATKEGVNHHCIILDSEEENPENEFTDSSVVKSFANSVVLYVYDSIKLEKTLTSEDEDIIDITSLVEDSSNASCYFSINSSGVHMINLQWIQGIKDMDVGPPSDVCFLICTQPREKSHSTEIVGFSAVEDKLHGTIIVCLLDTGELVTRITNNKSHDIENSLSLTEIQSQEVSTVYSSPLRRMSSTSFEEFLRNRCKKSCMLKSDGVDDKLTQKEFYQLLANAISSMRENYIERQTKAMIEMTKRCEILKKHKIQQMNALNNFMEDKSFFGFAELIADKLLSVSTNILSIAERIDNVMKFMQSTSSVMSDAEQKWKTEVGGMQTHLMHFKRNMEMLKQKAENLNFCKYGSRKSRADESTLNSNQLLKVKANLKEQNNRIADLVEKVKTISTRV